MKEISEFLERALTAQQAIDELLTPTQQARERQHDGTFRVCCHSCGKAVSSPLAMPVIVRALVRCPECLEQEAKA
jgi:hypothetical protein